MTCHPLYEALNKIPKYELHAHFTGSVSRSLLLHLAAQGTRLTAMERKRLERPVQDLQDCFSMFPLLHKLIRGRNRLHLAVEDIISNFSQTNCRYLELRSGPKDDPEHGVSFEDYFFVLADAVAQTSQLWGEDAPRVAWIVSVDRAKGIFYAERTIKLACELYKKGFVCGLDFSGDPTVGDFKEYRKLFDRARDQGLPATIHIAEVPDAVDTETILEYGPERLGHACCLSPTQFEALLQSRIPVEICLSSNLVTAAVESYENHQVKPLMAAGHPVCLATDDFALFESDLTMEYCRLADALQLTVEEIKPIAAQAEQFIFGQDV